ncbi:MAG: RecX family transcriptional regulator [Bdellovibrionales bacterium]|nr:RecX family transcriptional regulator [Bdellovibrionales bacterium]
MGDLDFQTRLRNFALKCLTGKELTQAQMRPRLEKWCRLADSDLLHNHAEAVDQVIQELVQDGWISDERTARAWMRHYAGRGKGAAFIQQKLRQKGIQIERSQIDEVTRAHTGLEEDQAVQELIQRKYPDYHESREKKARAMRGLQSRGFSTSAIFSAFRKLIPAFVLITQAAHGFIFDRSCKDPTVTWDYFEAKSLDAFANDLSKRPYGTSDLDIIRWNSNLTSIVGKLKKLGVDFSGVRLKIDLGKGQERWVVAQSGQTLEEIAQKESVSKDQLLKWNKKVVGLLMDLQALRPGTPSGKRLFDLTSLPVRRRTYSDGCGDTRDGLVRIETAKTIINQIDIYVLIAPTSGVSTFTDSSVGDISQELNSNYNAAPRAAGIHKVTLGSATQEVSFDFRVVPLRVDRDFTTADLNWFFRSSFRDAKETGASGVKMYRFPVLIRRTSNTGLQGGTTNIVTIDDAAKDPRVISHELGHVLMMQYRNRMLKDLTVDSNTFDHATGGIMASPVVQPVTAKNMEYFARALPAKN